ncbi:MAG: penicillin-binding protein 2 [Gammaproteobacteria bacterium]|nr:penicillin-binding protein 2 [Gammaproteobacteria bacterium]
MSQKRAKDRASGRRNFVLFLFFCLTVGLVVRAGYLQIYNYKFLREQGQARQNRVIEIPAHRGAIVDRNGAPLAVSTPIDTVWAVPEEMEAGRQSWGQLADILDYEPQAFAERIDAAKERGREFLYLRRQVQPDVSEQVSILDVPGVSKMREYARYYPARDAFSHVVGFTNVDGKGVEGLELSYDSNWLNGEPGKRRVVRDLAKREIESLEVIRQASPGKDLQLSLDRRLQYQAHIALDEAVRSNKAASGSLVVMDVKTGEILAMTNAPAYNPNNANERTDSARKRNRAVIDQFEPGSTMKPFTIAAALESGKFKPDDIVYTSPGYYKLGRYEIRDSKDYGWLDLRGIIKKSSNVGVTKVAQQLDPEQMWSVYDRFGFGRPPGSEFPGEVAGMLNHSSLWHAVEQTTLSYGYGLAVSVMQLTRAYAAIANGGVMPQVSFIKREDAGRDRGVRVISKETASRVANMLESVVSSEGTGARAKVPGYRVAGKTGTSYKSHSGGYDEESYISLFAGFAPVSNPRLAMVVVLHDPSAGEHYGGQVAAPVFAKVMGDALRIFGVKPDDWGSLASQVVDTIELENAL